MRFAREEIARRTPELSRWQLRRHRTAVASVAAIVADNLVQPEVYAVGGAGPGRGQGGGPGQPPLRRPAARRLDRAGRVPARRRPRGRRVRAALEARPPGLTAARDFPRRKSADTQGLSARKVPQRLGELGGVEADRGGRGEVEALRPAAHRDAHPRVGQRRPSSAGTPRASLPNSHSTGPARACRPSSSSAASPPPSAASTVTPGRLHRRDQRLSGARADDVDVEQAARRWPAPPCRRRGRPSRRRTPPRRHRRRPPSAGSCRRCPGRPARPAPPPAAAGAADERLGGDVAQRADGDQALRGHRLRQRRRGLLGDQPHRHAGRGQQVAVRGRGRLGGEHLPHAEGSASASRDRLPALGEEQPGGVAARRAG